MLSVKSAFFALFSIVGITTLQFYTYKKLDHGSNNPSLINRLENHTLEQQLNLLNALPKFGYQNIFADWTFLRFLQYQGNSDLRKITGYSLNIDYFENIIDNDPLFTDSYIFLVNSISMYAGEPEESIRLVETGLKHMTPKLPARSYFIWRHKATDELLFLGDTKLAQESYRTAADWAAQSPDKEAPFIEALSRKTVNFLATDPNSKPAQIGAWSDILLRATDDNIRQRAITQIEALGGNILTSEDGQVTVRYKTNGE